MEERKIMSALLVGVVSAVAGVATGYGFRGLIDKEGKKVETTIETDVKKVETDVKADVKKV
jgi:hypothetical protein